MNLCFSQLYDLMTMGFKYQLVTCTHPRELIEVTLNHLESIRFVFCKPPPPILVFVFADRVCFLAKVVSRPPFSV